MTTAAGPSTVRLPRRLVGITGSRSTSATTSATTRHSGLEIAGARILAVSFGRYWTVGIAQVGTTRVAVTRAVISPV